MVLLAAHFGNWNSVHRQHRRWTEAGVWDVMLAALSDCQAYNNTLQLIDFHHCPGESARRRRRGDSEKLYWPFARWAHDQGSSRANAEGLAVGFHVTPGQASAMTAYDDLMAEDAPPPDTMLGDKGYCSDAIKSDLERRGIDPMIPTRSNRTVQRTIDNPANRSERSFNRSITHAAWRPATTSSRPASLSSYSSQQFATGSVRPHALGTSR